MNLRALLGLLCILYTIAVFYITMKKPEKIWKMGKIQAFIKLMGEKGTAIFFYFFGLAVGILGIWLIAF